MKKSFLTMLAIVALLLVSCVKESQYKIEGERMANRLDELCQSQDAAGAIAMDDSIRAYEAEIVAAGDSAGVAEFRDAVRESVRRNAPIIAGMKVEAGSTTEEAVKPLIDDALNGDGDITTITKSINQAIRKDSVQ